MIEIFKSCGLLGKKGSKNKIDLNDNNNINENNNELEKEEYKPLIVGSINNNYEENEIINKNKDEQNIPSEDFPILDNRPTINSNQ